MSKKKTCGNCVHGDFSKTQEGSNVGQCRAARFLSHVLSFMPLPMVVSPEEPLDFVEIAPHFSAAHCAAYRAKEEKEK
jgi:hypothetical protein